MARFQAVYAQDNVVHVGVVDATQGHVLDLTTNDGVVSRIQTRPKSERKWLPEQGYSQVGSDDDVVFRWNKIVDAWHQKQEYQEDLPYDLAGQNGLNCECIVNYVMCGKLEAKLGKLAGWIRSKTGLDLGVISASSKSSR